jgi:hypothetical protein
MWLRCLMSAPLVTRHYSQYHPLVTRHYSQYHPLVTRHYSQYHPTCTAAHPVNSHYSNLQCLHMLKTELCL